MTLPEPQQIDESWKAWSFKNLPMLPEQWPLIPVEKTVHQLKIIKKLFAQTELIICATDAGREGELIFRYIYEYCKSKKPVKRLWISSLTKEAISYGLKNLKNSNQYDFLAEAAKGRSRADWLIGMNLSRAYALSTQEKLFVGRVQTPTLSLIVERDLKILNFVPESFHIIEAVFKFKNQNFKGHYVTSAQNKTLEQIKKTSINWYHFKSTEKELMDTIVNRFNNSAQSARIISTDGKKTSLPPPLLFDLTELQRTCNKIFGISASDTLMIAQNLYEKYKLISYPRTSSSHLSESVEKTLPEIINNIKNPYIHLISTETGTKKLSRRFVDDSKISDHHAIIPTSTPINNISLNNIEKKIYDLICKRLLMAWQSDYLTSTTTLLTSVDEIDIYKSQGTHVLNWGWKVLEKTNEYGTSNSISAKGVSILPEGLIENTLVTPDQIEALPKKTEPPPHLTDATLLTGMQTAGKAIEDKELAEHMKESGLGTPATRASIIETLLTRKYIERKNKNLVATNLGFRLINSVHSSIKSPELTAHWEKKLNEIQNGHLKLAQFIKELEEEIKIRLTEIKNSVKTYTNTLSEFQTVSKNRTNISLENNENNKTSSKIKNLMGPDNLENILKKYFGFDSFRKSQSAVCKSVTLGKDVLLVMPTGAGKSICYQVPGLARGGTTLVISPLVALIEDQVSKLQSLNLQAERIHSGRSKEESREVCKKYLNNELDFLFIAPERLSVPGFIEFLAKTPPTLIAIDEAHCISQWGHDFRPDYRVLGERLQLLRPSPIIALTATATPLVQDDICKQLMMIDEEKVIQGFRRTNISIEVSETSSSQRLNKIKTILNTNNRLPAIIYAPTRKKTDDLAKELFSTFKTGAYHAGMSSQAREKVQTQFLNGEIDIMIATVAFGMGIDKPNIRTVIHAAIPSSIEGYYQEIGRAGRDGLDSKAYLLHSYADQKTHEFLMEINYPKTSVLHEVIKQISKNFNSKNEIFNKIKNINVKFEEDVFNRCLEQLWIHRGVQLNLEDEVKLGKSTWQTSYELQKELKEKQLKKMLTMTQSNRCRMLFLVSHFGDNSDSGIGCGICDICEPTSSLAYSNKRPLNLKEKKSISSIFVILQNYDEIAAGRLYALIENQTPQMNRSEFEKIITFCEKFKWIKSQLTSFEKDGQLIEYRKIILNPNSPKISENYLEKIETTEDLVISKSDSSKKVTQKIKIRKKSNNFKYRN